MHVIKEALKNKMDYERQVTKVHANKWGIKHCSVIILVFLLLVKNISHLHQWKL